MRRSRVKFHSEHDLGSGWNLQKDEEILRTWDSNYGEEDIDEVLNYFNIKRYFDANLCLKDWHESTFTVLKDKCKTISIDGVLKQYRLFCKDGYVDRELLEISSRHIIFSNLQSLRNKKYAYSGIHGI